MLITKECDYAIRILRALSKYGKQNVQEISEKECMTTSITYKIARKLEKAEIIKGYRGSTGGYEVNKLLNQVSLYEVFLAIDKQLFVTECVQQGFVCKRNTAKEPCKVNEEFCKLQKLLYDELTSCSVADVV